MTATVVQHAIDHWGDLLAGGTAIGLLGHAVNTFPTPTNKYGSWFLGVIQWAVGQRVAAGNTLKGQQSVITGVVATGTGPGTIAGSDPNGGPKV